MSRCNPVSIAQGESALTYLTTAQASRPETRWNGQNRGGWSNLEFDRLEDAFLATLDPDERVDLLGREIALLSDQLTAIPLYFNPGVLAYPSTLRGVSLKAGDGEVDTVEDRHPVPLRQGRVQGAHTGDDRVYGSGELFQLRHGGRVPALG